MNNTYNPLLCLLSDRGELPPEKLALLEARERDSLKIKTIFDGTLTPNEIIYLDEEIDKYLIKSKDSNIQNGNPLEIRELIDNSNGKSGLALFGITRHKEGKRLVYLNIFDTVEIPTRQRKQLIRKAKVITRYITAEMEKRGFFPVEGENSPHILLRNLKFRPKKKGQSVIRGVQKEVTDTLDIT